IGSFNIHRTADQGWYISGHRNSLPGYKASVLRLDSLGNFNTNAIHGYLFDDRNQNCSQDANEPALSGQTLIATNANTGAVQYLITDNDGYYAMTSDTGTWTVALDTSTLAMSYWNAFGCGSASITHTFTVGYDSVEYDIPLWADQSCALMQVDISSSIMRRCFSVNYFVNWTNYGTITADSAYIVLDLDSAYSVTNASMPYTTGTNPNQLIFQLGDVAVGESGDLRIDGMLDPNCNATALGDDICAAAQIFPDTSCLTGTQPWNGADVVPRAECVGNSQVRFTVKNEGNGNMLSAGQVIIIEDNILRLDTNITLPAGDSMTVILPATGGSWFIEAEQVPGHPLPFNKNYTLIGCGGGPTLGFGLSAFPQNDAAPHISIDCQTVVGSYDPNDKMSSPTGLGVNHEIRAAEDLEYIIRFQNTGTDTAFTVVIKDSLPAELNPTSLVHGASSHNYSFSWEDGNTAVWRFDHIELVDSFTNEPGSHGFIKFRIQQVPGLQPGDLISNGARIYFDFNEAIYTPIWTNEITDLPVALFAFDPSENELEMIKTYPNPFSEVTTIELPRSYRKVAFEVYGMDGRKVQELNFDRTQRFEFERGSLPEGLYVFRIRSAGTQLGGGRLLIR
ncbi:MAG: T9SS type A sorting domain-containing protein, partial [Bacteroidota bacterium]